MSIGFKIRSLVLLLGICCIATAISIHHSLTKEDLLEREATVLQNNLSAKERQVNALLADKAAVENLQNLGNNTQEALNFINTYRDKGINVLIYKNSTLKFWSFIKVFPKNLKNIREGTSFIQLANGYFHSTKKTEGDVTILFLITVKEQFRIENQYLKSQLFAGLSPSGNLDIANFNDKTSEVQNINRLDGKFLFSVKLISNIESYHYAAIEIWMWIAGLIFICVFFNSFSAWLAKRGFLITGTLILALFFIAFRLSDLEYGWFKNQFNLEIFDPKIYAQSFFLPSLGDLLFNMLAITWLVFFIYLYRDKYKLPPWLIKSKAAGILFHFIVLALFTGIAYLIDDTFFGLIYNSRIRFDINIINLNWVTWVCVFLLCLAWLNVYLFAVALIKFTLPLNVTNRERLIVFLLAFCTLFIFRILTDFTAFFIIYALVLFLFAYNSYIHKEKFSILITAVSFFCLALVSSIKYIKFTDIKERALRTNIAQRLETADDPKVINAINIFERGIASDEFIKSYFENPMPNRQIVLQNYIERKYLDGFLSRYEIIIYSSAASGLKTAADSTLDQFKELVRVGALKTPESNFFYRVNDTFGYQNYFGIIPVFSGPAILGTLIVELKSQPYNYNLKFPDLLIDGKIRSESEYNNYSFAFYNNNVLVNQSGKISYSMINKMFKASAGELKFTNDMQEGINHLVYAPTGTKLIVISKERIAYITRLAALSFFFLVFIVFSFVASFFIWLIKNIESTALGWFNINKYLMINANRILYKTRIQVSIIFAVVVTLLVVGWTTFYNISEEYRKQQSEFVRDKIRKIQVSFEKQIPKTGAIDVSEQAAVNFNQFADVNGAFLNLYNTRGDLLLTSLPKMYDNGIVDRKMEPKAFIHLNKLQDSEFIDPEERVGSLTYMAAYVPIMNDKNRTIAYLGSPYYGNEADYEVKIDLFINTLINIYALVFVAIGILAVFLANQITHPLTFIQDSIRQTKLGQRNQPIHWSRHDEIGSLIREYNKMIAALEISAAKLARSERESAWREMAKQVAHEIKNPLTPLKLGVQLLERSWREKDPNFEQKFENFNRSFVEQIDSLAKIASEFSNFAKMPDTKLEKVELLPIIKQAKDVFKHTENAEIRIINKVHAAQVVLGDKDQLLRTFNNLLKNAIEAKADDKGCLIEITVYYDDSHIVVAVKDNGKGISTAQYGKIFTPNFTTKSSGTGLGLAFVKQAIENAGGEVSFRSAENKETIFYLSFPNI